MYDSSNAVEELKHPRKHPPKEKVEAITEALKYFEVSLPLVEDMCNRIVSEEELSHLLDYLLDLACDEKILELYKRVCRRYLHSYPGCIKSYIEAYWKMWEEEDSYLSDFS